jgi:hypothetical protein
VTISARGVNGPRREAATAESPRVRGGITRRLVFMFSGPYGRERALDKVTQEVARRGVTGRSPRMYVPRRAAGCSGRRANPSYVPDERRLDDYVCLPQE